MNHLKLLLGFAALFLSSYPQSSIARDSPFTRHGTGPRYWIAYEECFVTNVPLSEERWKALDGEDFQTLRLRHDLQRRMDRSCTNRQ